MPPKLHKISENMRNHDYLDQINSKLKDLPYPSHIITVSFDHDFITVWVEEQSLQ